MVVINPILWADGYKFFHNPMYPVGTTKIYSNLTPRKSRVPGVDFVVVAGVQAFLKKRLIEEFNENFFGKDIDAICLNYERVTHITNCDHIRELHALGYLPLEIRCLPEGTLCPIGVPLLTISTTNNQHGWVLGWVTNYLETLASAELWPVLTSATTAYLFRQVFEKGAMETVGHTGFVPYQGHNFSMRGCFGVEAAILVDYGHVTSFMGSDTTPAKVPISYYYGDHIDTIHGALVPASEHSVMCMGTKEGEKETILRLLALAKENGWPILSLVLDTWDLWHVLTVILPSIKQEIIDSGVKLVVRPDTGDPADILCGTCGYGLWESREEYEECQANDELPDASPEETGVVEILWEIFGGTTNSLGYKELAPCIGTIYGDSITLERAKDINERLKAKGFATTNWVAGMGSYTYTYVTRDTFGFAIKATYGEVNGEGREIFKDPATDPSKEKKSAKGLVKVVKNSEGKLTLIQGCSYEDLEKQDNEHKVIFLNSHMVRTTTLAQIRSRLGWSL